MTVGVVATVSTGHPGGSGYSQLCFDWAGTADTAALLNYVATFWTSLAVNIPASITHTVQPTVNLYDEVSGSLIGEDAVLTPPAAVPGSGSGSTPWAAGTGCSITWITGAIARGRRIKGRTFVAPILTSSFASDGTLSSGMVTLAATAANDLIANSTTAGAPLVVWTRPHTSSTKDPRPSYPGDINQVINAQVKDQVASLRGRRF